MSMGIDGKAYKCSACGYELKIPVDVLHEINHGEEIDERKMPIVICPKCTGMLFFDGEKPKFEKEKSRATDKRKYSFR